MHIREEPGLTDGMIHICNMKSNIPVVQRSAHLFHHILQEEILSMYNMKKWRGQFNFQSTTTTTTKSFIPKQVGVG
jgi:hypothetical protein